jgi:hypothetical protein
MIFRMNFSLMYIRVSNPGKVVVTEGQSMEQKREAVQSQQSDEAKLIAACTRADYLDRYGHTSDYIAIVNRTVVPLFPSVKKYAFSDRIFAETNNHGRIFGPVFFKVKYWFCAAFSREKFHVEPFEHTYVSFNQARDRFAWSLNDGNLYNVKNFVNLGNVILGSNIESSGDHDGIAIFIEAME